MRLLGMEEEEEEEEEEEMKGRVWRVMGKTESGINTYCFL